MNAEGDRLRLDYEQTLATVHQLTEIRFKLLAFVPTISGAAIALLSQTSLRRPEKAILAAAGFLVTLGIVLYDERNTQFYNGAISRAQFLETELNLEAFGGDRHVGLFGSRKDHRTRLLFGLRVGHDLGLAIIYSSVLGAWAFAVVEAGWSANRSTALVTGVGMACAALLQFRWHNGKPESLWRWWRDKVRRREMQHDKDVLRDLNVKIGLAEAQGDREFLGRVLAPVFAFRRASGALVDRAAFLADVGPSAHRDTEIESVALLGHDRAIVECAVTLIDGTGTKRFHNVRLFVRSRDGDWTLLGWASESLEKAGELSS